MAMDTRIVKVPSTGHLGKFSSSADGVKRLEHWEIDDQAAEALSALQEPAAYLRTKDIPVAFPTETVYGLGADATRSASVKGIYAAKGRPSDNPLIVHVCDLAMLRTLLGGTRTGRTEQIEGEVDLIPQIYKPLVQNFWPGPLTLLFPNPTPSKLASEVTAGLASFGVRMPSSPLALSLIKMAGVPLAAPSANASTKPSPTTAQHVKHDLDGKIELILDGGSCHVGVESTVVDGLCDPPVVLRPGGISMDELRKCAGWENTVKAYKDASEEGKAAAPRAPGMKYKHYSPKARVVLYESNLCAKQDGIEKGELDSLHTGDTAAALTNGEASQRGKKRIGVIRTQRWKPGAGLEHAGFTVTGAVGGVSEEAQLDPDSSYQVLSGDALDSKGNVVGQILDINLGREARGVAQGIFAALRELDQRGADVIFIEGIDDKVDIAAAVMNRLRKAASEIRS